MVAHGFKIQPSLKMHTGTHYKHSSAYHLKTIDSLSPTLALLEIRIKTYKIEQNQTFDFYPKYTYICSVPHKLWWQIVGVGEHAMHFNSGMCGIYCSPNPKKSILGTNFNWATHPLETLYGISHHPAIFYGGFYYG